MCGTAHPGIVKKYASGATRGTNATRGVFRARGSGRELDRHGHAGVHRSRRLERNRHRPSSRRHRATTTPTSRSLVRRSLRPEGMRSRNLGDGLMFAFFSPSRALACAVAMQPGIERQNRRAEIPLAVRIGIADGSPSATSDLGTWAFLLREWRFRPIPRSYPIN
jgi:class 3 adenylate cyclase